MKIKLNDVAFYGDSSSSRAHASKHIEWYRGPKTHAADNNLVFFTDDCIPMGLSSEYKDSFKVAWLLEPYVISPQSYEFIKQHHDKFDLVITHHKAFLRLGDNFAYYPNGMCWIPKEKFGIHPKSKNVQIIASSKNYTIGHQKRHQLIQSCDRNKIDVFGNGYGAHIVDKCDCMKDYRFSIAIENCSVSDYFTEKLIDCFMTGTVPIYWGCPEIGQFFNVDGLFCGQNIEEIHETLNDLDGRWEETYNKMLPAIKENFKLAQRYLVAEDRIFEDILRPRGLV